MIRNDLDPGGAVCGIDTTHSGTYYWCQDGPAWQDISLAAYATEIDAGRFRLQATTWGAGNTALFVQWRSALDAVLGVTPTQVIDVGVWTEVTTTGVAPVGTRTARIMLDGLVAASSSFDDVTADYCTAPAAPDPSTPAAGTRNHGHPPGGRRLEDHVRVGDRRQRRHQ